MPGLYDLNNDDIQVVISELLVATADNSDPLLDDTVKDVLRTLRARLGMDVVFVSEFIDGKRMFRFVDRDDNAPELRAGDAGAIEESVCQRIVDGRLPPLVHDVMALPKDADVPALPFRVGGHLSTPIVLSSGHAYGTLCCFSSEACPTLREKDLATLKLCAQLVARKLEMAGQTGLVEPPSNWALEPLAQYRSSVWHLP